METKIIGINGTLYLHTLGFLTEEQYNDMKRVYQHKPTMSTIYNYIGKLFPNESVILDDTTHKGMYVITRSVIEKLK